ncbi:MAG: hypothetical protein ACYCV4_05870 [Dermatophilaceae bacterium]
MGAIQLIAEVDTDTDTDTDTDADALALARLGALTERCCVAAQSLAEPPSLRIRRTAT